MQALATGRLIHSRTWVAVALVEGLLAGVRVRHQQGGDASALAGAVVGTEQ